MLSRALAGKPFVVDPDQFTESQPVIMRYRLNSLLVLGGSYTASSQVLKLRAVNQP
ncbi:MAG TPA: hypothetical protein VEI45_21780 [Mycobacterium sp.]|uniref:hypothetical protein n=1 Tax=Mycobacterium sp. TaxID=1785 RepID=UPI002D2DCB53|nr:hypothetical protein [Mycobacterium sp.]HXY66924.1 hypothetical protein [Mycobacterium sp.]